MLMVTTEQAQGCSNDHLVQLEGHPGLYHERMVESWLQLNQAAAVAGFDLVAASSFRSFERQLAIWTAKAEGRRPLLDDQGEVLDSSRLTREQLLWAILRWSALPGASRHHWGTDVDVYDRAAVASDYQVQLVGAEYGRDGPFGKLSEWLSGLIVKQQSFGFFRPYAHDCGGVAPEPWHLSYAPVAKEYEVLLTPEQLLPLWRKVQLPLLDVVEANIERVFERYVCPPAVRG